LKETAGMSLFLINTLRSAHNILVRCPLLIGKTVHCLKRSTYTKFFFLLSKYFCSSQGIFGKRAHFLVPNIFLGLGHLWKKSQVFEVPNTEKIFYREEGIF